MFSYNVTYFIQVHASDEDLAGNAAISYSLLFSENGGTEWFAINSTTGDVYIQKSLASLDADSFMITVEASDQPTDSSHSRFVYN